MAFCFLLMTIVGVFLFWGGEAGLRQLAISLFGSMSFFTLLPLPLLILVGEVMLHSGMVPHMMNALDKLMGRLPGRLGLLAVAGGTVFATLSGSSVGSVAMLGEVLTPDMEERGYKKAMSLGPILGSGGLAIMIPPSNLAVILGAIAEISIGKILIAIIIPGLLMATLYASYIIGRCYLQPSIAPAYEITPTSILQKVVAFMRYVLPLGFIVFLVIGLIILGIATPTESAATGAIGCFILAVAYRRFNWQMVKKAILGTLRTMIMIFMIIASAQAFSQVLSFSGVGMGISKLLIDLPLAPIFIIVSMQVLILFLGMFIGPVAIMMITLPIFMPIIYALGFNPVWFTVIVLLNMEMSTTSPPYGLSLFVMKGVAPPDTTMMDIYRAALPFLLCDLIVMVLIIAFPTIALWLPGLMK